MIIRRVSVVHQAQALNKGSQHRRCRLESWSHNKQIFECSDRCRSDTLHQMQFVELYLADSTLLGRGHSIWNSSWMLCCSLHVCTSSRLVELLLNSRRFLLWRISVLDLGHIAESSIAELPRWAISPLSSSGLGTTVSSMINSNVYVWIRSSCEGESLATGSRSVRVWIFTIFHFTLPSSCSNFSWHIFLFFVTFSSYGYTSIYILDSTDQWYHAVFALAWLISLSIILSRAIHICASGRISFFFMVK